MRPGQEERIEFEYIRHGVVCLIASFDVVTGKSLSPTSGPTRNEVGDSEEPEVAAGVSDRSRTSHSFHLRPEAQLVAESGGDLV